MGETVQAPGSLALALVVLVSALSGACRKEEKPRAELRPSASASGQPHGVSHPQSIPTPPPAAAPTPPPGASTVSLVTPSPEAKKYPWFGLEGANVPKAVDNLESRFPPPPDYKRVPVESGSFGEWQRA